ncbi:MAG: hypothetical protein V2I25_04135 [Woeseiaceae bacterium]|nr:hypothetical protein [Woeseiaceae bacterium]
MTVARRRRCAYLTMEDMSGFVTDSDLSVPAMAALGWDVEFVPWRRPAVDWDRFELVYICTPWDYQADPAAFIGVLERIEASAALLINPLALVRWNLDKTYLRELEAAGVKIVPSLWFDAWSTDALAAAREAFSTAAIVVKPQLGANADHTYLVPPGEEAGLLADMAASFRARPYFVQPFIESIRTEGEYSLFYLDGAYSHAIRKTPQAGDFRSQEEHGAGIRAVAADEQLRAAAAAAMRCIEPAPAYARLDFVRGPGDDMLLMELELIEPSLYLRMDTASPARFARALDAAARASG